MPEEQLDLNLPINDDQKKRDEWEKKIKAAEKYFDAWFKSGDKIVERYRDERDANSDDSMRQRKYNIFWSNVQTLGPAVYSRCPKPEVNRRYFDKDPVGRLSSVVMERALSYEMDVTSFHDEALLSRDDYLLTGRGTLWQRYEPLIETTEQPAPETGGLEALGQAQPGVETLGGNGGPPLDEKVIGENAPTDYVHWKDFLHSPVQNWKQVTWVSRRVLMSKAETDKRWPEKDEQGFRVSHYLSYVHQQQKDDNKQKTGSTVGNLALIYEIWDKDTFTVKWYSPDLKTRLIEDIEDPLKLMDFFPCPAPLYATMTTDRLIPRPDYKLYQDQAIAIDTLTQRIALLTKACAVRGVYDKSNGQLADLLNERPENFMVGVDNWAAFAEKGGLQGQTSFIPIDQVVKVITALSAQRQSEINDVYAITGIADIVRGASVASETATAQQIKGQFANLRLNSRREAIARFLRDALRIKAEVIAEHFGEDTLRKISGFDQMTEVLTKKEKGEDIEALWKQVHHMLKEDPLRLTHLVVQTDSIVDPDLQQEQQARVEFLTAVGGFLEKAVMVGEKFPQIAPLIGQMISWGVRGFKVGRDMEASIDDALEKLEAAAAQTANQPPPPNPEVIKAQQEGELQKAESAREDQKIKLEHERGLAKIRSDARLAMLELTLQYGAKAVEDAAKMVPTEEGELNGERDMGLPQGGVDPQGTVPAAPV